MSEVISVVNSECYIGAFNVVRNVYSPEEGENGAIQTALDCCVILRRVPASRREILGRAASL